MTENKAANRYLRRVSRRMCCSKATKERLLDGLREELSEYPAAEYASLCGFFGTPEQAASALTEGVGGDEVRRAKRARKGALVAAIAALVVIAVACGTFALDKYMKYGRPGTTVVVIEEITNSYVSEEKQ